MVDGCLNLVDPCRSTVGQCGPQHNTVSLSSDAFALQCGDANLSSCYFKAVKVLPGASQHRGITVGSPTCVHKMSQASELFMVLSGSFSCLFPTC